MIFFVVSMMLFIRPVNNMLQSLVNSVDLSCPAVPHVASTASPFWPAFAGVVAVLLTIAGKWWTDVQAEKREARHLLTGAIAEIDSFISTYERLHAEAALERYITLAGEGKPVPLLANFDTDPLPVTRMALKKAGRLPAEAVSVFTSVAHQQFTVISMMKAIKDVWKADSPTRQLQDPGWVLVAMHSGLLAQAKHAHQAFRNMKPILEAFARG